MSASAAAKFSPRIRCASNDCALPKLVTVSSKDANCNPRWGENSERMPPLAVDKNNNVECTCVDTENIIMCKICGHLIKGRIMTTGCPIHPRVFHLMDCSHCPQCRSTCLKYCFPTDEAKLSQI
ncbi:unnamed protein product [Clavelina lepadiformis]|uniref:RING-type domain-containing protein n=1 Tax=Clavelina lepadiformis TaxID=159417 RepID=A0ABP0FUU7_CLALP